MALVKPLPAHKCWSTLHDTLSEVFHDFQHTASRKHLLSVDSVVDVRALSAANAAELRTFSCTVDTDASNGFQATEATQIEVFYPSWRDDDAQCTAGVTIESNFGTGAVKEIFSSPTRLARYVANGKRNSTLFVYNNEKHVEFAYISTKNGFRKHAIIWFDRQMLDRALRDGSVDIADAGRAITKTITGSIPWDMNVPVNTAFTHPGVDTIAHGSFYASSTISLYADTMAMLVMPVYAIAQWVNNAPSHAVDLLRNWALETKLQQVNPSPPLTKIAPAPSQPSASSLLDEDCDRKRRAEKRRINNRISAARSNARKRQLRLLQREKHTNSCNESTDFLTTGIPA